MLLTALVFLGSLHAAMTVSCGTDVPIPYRFRAVIFKTTTYTPKTFKWDESVLLGQYKYYKNPPDGYTVGYFTTDICSDISFISTTQAYAGGAEVTVSKTACAVDASAGTITLVSSITFMNRFVDGYVYKTGAERMAQAKALDGLTDAQYSTWLLGKIRINGGDIFKALVDGVSIKDYSYLSQWYNRDYDSGNIGPGPHQTYVKGKSLFKLCEVGTTLGTSTTNVNFHDAKSANQDCLNMNLYKCAAFCLVAEDCESAMFLEGPVDDALKLPRNLCAQFRADLDETIYFPADDWGDLTKATCKGDSCSACTHKSTSGVTACMLREFLKTRDDFKLSPLIKQPGAKVIFMDHLVGIKIQALNDLQSKCN